jgi:hypothetical protein
MGVAFVLVLAGAAIGLSGQDALSGQASLHCLRVVAPLSQDSIPRSDAFERAGCEGAQPSRAFRYDRSRGVSQLTRSLAAGDVVAPFPEYGEDVALPGQMLNLVVAIGNVRVERQVEALQEARPGERLFVRSRDGQILSVRYEEGEK